MAFTGSFFCTSAKAELLSGLHNFNTSGGNTFKLALYDNTATLDASTTAYTASGEVSGQGYTAGGANLTNISPTTSGTTAFVDFQNLTFPSASITARGALIYNSTNNDRAVAVLDFGEDKTSSSADFTIVFPAANPTLAIIRLG